MNNITKRKFAIGWFSILNGIVYSNWGVLIPEVKLLHSLSNGQLGAILAVAILGSFLALFCAPKYIEFFGSKSATYFGSILLLLSFTTLGINMNNTSLVISVLFVGFTIGWADISSTCQDVAFERLSETPTIGFFASCYAVGNILGSLLAGVLLELNFSVLEELLFVALVFSIPSFFCNLLLIDPNTERRFKASSAEVALGSTADIRIVDTEKQQNDSQIEEQKTEKLDYYVIVMLSLMCFIAYLGEGSVIDWSAIYLRDLQMSPFISSFGIISFQLIVAISRYASDYALDLIGRRMLLLLTGLISFMGLFLVFLAPFTNIWLALVGFSLFGLGIAPAVPVTISMTGSYNHGMDTAKAVALVSASGYVGIMSGPPLLGSLSVLLDGLQWSFLVDGVIMLSATIIALFLPSRIFSSSNGYQVIQE